MSPRHLAWRTLTNMAASPSSTPSAPILEGVLAIHKPPALTSARTIRTVQSHFDPSALFAPYFARETARISAESPNQKRKRGWRGTRPPSVKIGHGGTLDPLATGVLILGIGSGTKALGHFTTSCVKSYEADVLFGAATDTYDSEGKIVARAEYAHVTRERVEAALEGFRGKGMQKPPIFSALKVRGKKLYEYAREGKEVPIEIQKRPVEVLSLEMVGWSEGGTHEWRWPEEEAELEVKQVAEKVLHFGEELAGELAGDAAEKGGSVEAGQKRAREDDGDVDGIRVEGSPAVKRTRAADNIKTQDADANDPTTANVETDQPTPATPNPTSATDANPPPPAHPSPTTRPPCPAPACRLRMTVTSGFYVRSLCQDLGTAVGSLALMAGLVRTRQGEFELGRNVLEYEDLLKGESVWGPKVRGMLEGWRGVGVEKEKEGEVGGREEGIETDAVESRKGWAEVGGKEAEEGAVKV